MKNHCEKNPELFSDKKIFVLRNFPKRGIGFFESVNFYPDFIIWILKDNASQHILFVDPHSTAFSAIESEREAQKLAFGKEIKQYEERLRQRCPGYAFTLDSFIVDVTHTENLGGVWEAKHIYGQDPEGRYIEKILGTVI